MKSQATHRLQVRTVVVRISRKLRATYRVRRGRLFSDLLVAMLTVFSPLARALPDTATMNVTAGQVNVDPSSNANSLVLNQGTNKAILDWRTFNIGAGESVKFQQLDASSVALNRISGGATSIYGSLSANGQVFLVNPAGVLFAPGAQVNVGGLVASTLDLSNSDFLAGRYTFSGGGGSVVNQGSLKGRYVVLAAPQVTNAGSIEAQRGSVGLLAGSRVTVDPSGAGLVKFSVDGAAVDAAIVNSGSITADGGQVAVLASAISDTLPTVINQSGVIRANSIANENGTIVLSGGATGIVQVSGTLQAKGANAGETGGTVKVLGDRVGLMAGAKVDASGDAGGGTVLVGGNFQGKGTEQNASVTYVDKDASIDASATNAGNGGTVIVWADKATVYRGSIAARGEGAGADGGFVEVSGTEVLDFDGTVNAVGGVGGRNGTLLLDPANIEIVSSNPDLNGDGTTGDDLTAPTLAAGGFPGATSRITSSSIVAQLNGASVTLAATNNIDVNARIDATLNGAGGNLTLDAGGTLTVNNTVWLRNGNTFTGTGGNGVVVTGSGSINDNFTNANTTLTATTGNVSIAGSVGNTFGNTTLTASAGQINHTGGTLRGNNLSLSASGGVTAGSLSVGSLTTSANTSLTATDVTTSGVASLGGNVTTSGAAGQSYGSTTLTNNVTLASGAAANAIRLGAVTGGGNNLTVTSGNTTIASTVTTLGNVNIAHGLTTTGALNASRLVVTGAASLGGDVTTLGAQQTYGSLSLTNNVVLQNNGGTVGLGSSVTGNNRDLTISTTGGAVATGAISGVAQLRTTSGSGTVTATDISANSASLGGNLTANLGNIVIATGTTLTADAIVSANAGAGTLAIGTVTGNGGGTPHNLMVTGNAILGTTSGVSALTANQTLTTTSTVNATSVAVTGQATLGGNVSTSAGQNYSGGLSLNAATVQLQDIANSAITVGTALAGNGKNLTIASNGTTTLANATNIGTFTGGTNGTTNGAITATTYNVNGGTVNATLGAGTLNTSGTTALNGTAGATVVNVNAGTLTLGSAERLADTAAVTVFAGATLATAATETIGSLAGAGNVANGGQLWVGGNNTSTTFSGSISGGSLGKTGTGTLALTGTNNFAANTQVLDGTLSVNGNAINDGNHVQVVGTGILALTGSETVGSIGGNGTVALGANTLTTGGAFNSNFSGVISGTGGLTKVGATTFTLGGTNTYTGATTISAGTLQIAGGSIAASSGVANSGTLDLQGSTTVAALSGTGTTSLNANTLTVGDGRNLSSSYAGAITGTGGMTKAGSGTLTLSGTSNYSGGTNIAGGTLSVASAGAAGTGAINIGLNNTLEVAGVTIANNVTTTSAGTLRGTGTAGVSGGIAIAAGMPLTVDTAAAGDSLALSGAISGGGSQVTKTGAGTVTMTGANTYGGATGVAAGTLRVNGNSLSDGAATSVVTGATLELTGSETVGSLSGGGNIVLGAHTLTSGGNGLSSTYSGVASGTGGLAKAGAGTLTLTGSNTYTGATSVNAGTLALGHPTNTLNDSTAVSVASGATLGIGANTDTVGSLALAGTLAGTGTLTAATYTLDGGTVNANLGAGTLTQASGTSTLNGTAAAGTVNVTGGTLALGATANRLTAPTTVTIAAGATLNTGTASQSLGSAAVTNDGALVTGAALSAASIGGTGTATLGGNVTTTSGQAYLGGATLTSTVTLADTANSAITVATSLTGGGNDLTIASSGTTTLANATGIGTFTAGTNGTTDGSITATTYNLRGGTVNATLGSGTLNQVAGTTLLNGISGSTAVNVNAGTLRMGGTNVLNAGATVSVTAGATLDLDTWNQTVGSATINGTLAGTSTLTAATYNLNGATVSANLGTGTLNQQSGASTLSGTSAAGTVNVNGGTLQLANTANRLLGATAVTVAAGATLDTGTASQSLGAANLTNNGMLATHATLSAGSIGGTGSASLGGDVTTTGAQGYGGPVQLTANSTVASTGGGAITFGGTVDGAFALAVNTGGTTTFAGSVGGTTALASVNVAGSTALDGGAVTTTGAQAYTGPATLGADTMLTGSDVTFGSTVIGAHALTVNTTGGGTTTFDGAVSVASLATNADGATVLNGGVTTTGAQAYDDAVTVAAGTTLSAGESLSATNAGNAFGSGVQFNVTQGGGGTGTLDVSGDFAGSTRVGGDATTVNLADTSAGTALVVTGLSAAAGAGVTLVSAGAMQVDAAALSPVATLTATTQNGDMVFLNSGTLRGGTPGVLATGALTLNVTGGALNTAADPLVINAGTPVVNISAAPAYTRWEGHLPAPAPSPAPAPEPTPAAAPDQLVQQAAGVAGTVSGELDALLATQVRDGAGLLRTERLVFINGLLPEAAVGPAPFRVTAIRLPRCADEQKNGQPGCR